MDNFRITIKSFIVNDDNEVLLIKRSEKDVHKPGVWEIPGGRLKLGEKPFDGLKREIKEEVNLDVEIINSINVHHFTRQDGQQITMLVFLCKPLTTSIILSEEHTNHEWIHIDQAKEKIVSDFHKEIDIFKKYFMKN